MNKTSCSANSPIKLVYKDGQNYLVRYCSGKGKTITKKELTKLIKLNNQYELEIGKSRTVEPSKDKILWHK